MTTITAYISDDLNNALGSVAKLKERSKSFIISKAIENYIAEQLKDLEDAEEALAVMNDRNMKCYTSDEVKAFIKANCRD